MIAGPEEGAAAGRGHLRAAHADREHVIEALKGAFVHGRLTKDELDTRVGQAFTSQTYAELAALTAGIPRVTADAAGVPGLPARARRGPLARAAVRAGIFLVIEAAVLWAASIADPGGNGPGPGHLWVGPVLLLSTIMAFTALCLLAHEAGSAWKLRRSRGQLPPPGPGGHALEGGPHAGTGHAPDPPPTGAGQARASARAHKSRQVPAPAGRAPCGARQAPGFLIVV